MKLKNTLILLALAGALVAFIMFYEQKQLSTQEEEERAGQVVQLDRDKVDTITIKNTETKIELRKDAKGGWRLEEPVKDRADTTAVAQLLTAAESLRYDAMIGEGSKGAEKDQLKEFGLTNSEIKVRFAGTEKPVELLFGKDAAVEGKVYVKRADSNSAYVIKKELKDQISKKTDEFRDRKLSDLSTTQVKRVIIKAAAGEMEFEKKDQHWLITKPLKARGDDAKIGDLISQATTARIESFVADSSQLAAYGLQDPRGSVSMFVEGSEQPTVLQIGGKPTDEKDKEKTYAKLSTRDAVVLVPKSVETLLETKPNDVRDKNLLRLEKDIVDRITIEGAGKEKIVLARSGESWVRKVGDKDEPINTSAATRLLDEMSNQQVTAFVADVGTDLATYGLDEPSVKVTFSSYASENTAETKAGEKPIAALHFGKTENGTTYAKLEEEPFIVSVPESAVALAMSDPLQWQALDIYKHKPEEITALEIIREGAPAVALERAPDQTWKLAKGDGAVNQINVQSLVNTLSTLHAVRWFGAAVPDHGFEKPAVVVSFKTGASGGGKLTIGGTSPEELAFALAEGRNGTFGISRPDVTAFQLPIIDKPAVTTPAAAPGTPAGSVPPASTDPAPVPAPAVPSPSAQ
ncbi:MAG TPA: DUF4340 domain-containing protein [Chthoniobacteraceae bacterium]|jgi:hypothetical protein|nr:DUF4340 domain-containing protein [Chthoniobacteraceae bacterium]